MATSDWWFAFVPAPGKKITPEITNQLATSFHECSSTRRASPKSSIDLLAVAIAPP